VQNIVVTIVALGAAGYFVRRLFGHPPAQASAGAPPCVSGAGCQLHKRS
jgi:hypothetical protein